MVQEFLAFQWPIELLAATKDAIDDLQIKIPAQIPLEIVTKKIFTKISDTQSPQGILAMIKMPENNIDKVLTFDRIIIADGVSDPGNMGTIIRTAAAFGFKGLITTPGSADVYNPKVVRASQGLMAQISTISHLDHASIIARLKYSHQIYALSLNCKNDLDSVKITEKLALTIGAEIKGVSKEFIDAANYLVRIPMTKSTESLNAAMAAGIAMYRFSRIR